AGGLASLLLPASMLAAAAAVLNRNRLVERGDRIACPAAARRGDTSSAVSHDRPGLGRVRAHSWCRLRRALAFVADKARVLAASINRASASLRCVTARCPLACAQDLAGRNRGRHCGWCRAEQCACEGECK